MRVRITYLHYSPTTMLLAQVVNCHRNETQGNHKYQNKANCFDPMLSYHRSAST